MTTRPFPTDEDKDRAEELKTQGTLIFNPLQIASLFSFFAGSQKKLQLALRGPNLPASLEVCKLQEGTRHRRNRRNVVELCFILSKSSVH
jgi:hypothetical protein